MQRNVVILDIDYVTYEGKPVIRLFSKEGDKNIVLIDDTFEPYLYVVSDDIDECMQEIQDNIDVARVEKVTKKDFQMPMEFIKVTFKHPQELAKNRDALRDLETVMQIREFDIPFDRQQLADYLNVERTALSKELGRMRREGYFEVRKNHFALPDSGE